MATVDIGKVRPTNEGEWVSTRSYEAMSVVTRDGATYWNTQDTPAGAYPESEHSIYWLRIGRDGKNGEPGNDGEPGPVGPPWPQPPISDSIVAADSGTYASSMAVFTAYQSVQNTVTVFKEEITTAVDASLTSVDNTLAEAIKRVDEKLESINAIIATYVPRGIITLWSGVVAAIPSGWALCNGQNGTPYLMNRFIVGAGNWYEPHATGGNDVHSHTTTVAGTTLTSSQMPSHAHTQRGFSSQEGNNASNTIYANSTLTDTPYSWATRSMSHATDGNGGNASHTHSATTGESYNLPLYYALCYIMKL